MGVAIEQQDGIPEPRLPIGSQCRDDFRYCLLGPAHASRMMHRSLHGNYDLYSLRVRALRRVQYNSSRVTAV